MASALGRRVQIVIDLMRRKARSRSKPTKLVPPAEATPDSSKLAMKQLGGEHQVQVPTVPVAVNLGDLRRTSPISADFGFDRGKPVDRGYIEQFLARHSEDIKGRVLEIGDNAYTMRFGGDRVEISDVFNRFPGAARSTFLGDLTEGGGLPGNAFDCIIMTQTLQLIFDVGSAVEALWRALKPGGILLVTVPWVSPMDRSEWVEGWYWSFSPAALRRLLEAQFDSSRVAATSYGNVLSATAFIYGLAEHELTPAELDVKDPFCPVLVAGRARK